MESPNPSPSFASADRRLWRPAAQRNMRNQWSRLAGCKQRWASASSDGRAHATSLVNTHLSKKYMPSMDFGVLKEMPDIQKKSYKTLSLRQELYGERFLSSYKNLVNIVSDMVNASRSMRCYLKGSAASPILQFGNYSEDKNDSGVGGGVSVFSFYPISYFENLGQELVEMFVLELSLKRLLVVELLSLCCEEPCGGEADMSTWSDEIYPGEFDDLCSNGLFSKESSQPLPPKIKHWEYDIFTVRQTNHHLNCETLQNYLTTWLAEGNIDTIRIDEIFHIVEGEMQVRLS
ncbi:hypothetical protein QJS10_CPA06g02330 [Acorus calamus]|uniref:F-box associated domain-containing protein n=1 Tax=Acorus calamus TaxID=4465 RepID=A0AAV9ENU4_ACOCL|nr:hypothetical protein QJS10_CPA06g02330 [Acorus calamus]